MDRTDLARLLALAEQLSPHLSGPTAERLAVQLDDLGVSSTLDGVSSDLEGQDSWLADGLVKVTAGGVRRWQAELEQLDQAGVELLTVADADYPRNLRMIANRPPLLFVRGGLQESDDRAMAVVGTRAASAEGIKAAGWLARELAKRGVTVVSGLAEGIDTAAHSSALNAGGRTLAVFGTGIRSVFPAKNRGLAEEIERRGACISQFWPDQHGARWTFPLRNIVTSGLSIGTAVIEAGETSGAKLQAQDALRHGKRLFLLDRLVTQPWAKAMVDLPGVTVVSAVEEVTAAIDFELGTRELDLVL